jgi:hypothetical protein
VAAENSKFRECIVTGWSYLAYINSYIGHTEEAYKFIRKIRQEFQDVRFSVWVKAILYSSGHGLQSMKEYEKSHICTMKQFCTLNKAALLNLKRLS